MLSKASYYPMNSLLPVVCINRMDGNRIWMLSEYIIGKFTNKEV